MWIKIKSALDKSLEWLTAILMAALTIDVTWQVITRFILKNPSDWTEELATFLMIWVGLLGAAVALNRGAHLGIDYFVSKFKPANRLFTELFVHLSVGFFSVGVMLLGGLKLVTITMARGQISPALKIPMGYVYLAIPIAGFFLTYYSLEFLIETIIKLKAKNKNDVPYVKI